MKGEPTPPNPKLVKLYHQQATLIRKLLDIQTSINQEKEKQDLE